MLRPSRNNSNDISQAIRSSDITPRLTSSRATTPRQISSRATAHRLTSSRAIALRNRTIARLSISSITRRLRISSRVRVRLPTNSITAAEAASITHSRTIAPLRVEAVAEVRRTAAVVAATPAVAEVITARNFANHRFKNLISLVPLRPPLTGLERPFFCSRFHNSRVRLEKKCRFRVTIFIG
jgi:hypothetical protein